MTNQQHSPPKVASKSVDYKLWGLYICATSLMMVHNWLYTYNLEQKTFPFYIAAIAATITVITVELTPAYFLSYPVKGKIETAIAILGIVFPVVLSGIISLAEQETIRSGASKLAIFICFGIVVAWKMIKGALPDDLDAKQSLLDRIKELGGQVQSLTAELASAKLDAQRGNDSFAGERSSSDRLRADLTASNAGLNEWRNKANALSGDLDAERGKTAHLTGRVDAANAENDRLTKLVNQLQADLDNSKKTTKDLMLEMLANGETIRQADIADRLSVSKATISTVAGTLEKEGRIEKLPDGLRIKK